MLLLWNGRCDRPLRAQTEDRITTAARGRETVSACAIT
jgi:hypothetical protein